MRQIPSWRLHYCNTLSIGRGLIAQGYDPTNNSYTNRFQPYIAYWGAGWTLFFTIINGFSVFWHFNAAGFLTACTRDLLGSTGITLTPTILTDINIPIFVVLYVGYKVVYRTEVWRTMDMDFVTVSSNATYFHLLTFLLPGYSDTTRD